MVPVMLQRIVELPSEVRARSRHQLAARRSPSAARRSPATSPAARWTRSARSSSTPTARPRSRSPSTATPADLRAGAGDRGAAADRGPKSGCSTPDGAGRCRPGEPGRIFVGSELAVERLLGRRRQGDDRRSDVERRPRPPRRRGTAVHRRREDDMIVSGGENVFPGEVEDLLAEPPGDRRGRGDRRRRRRVRPAAVRLRRRPRGRARSTPTRSATTCKANLARYKVPREVEFLDALPRNPTGKVLKRELG